MPSFIVSLRIGSPETYVFLVNQLSSMSLSRRKDTSFFISLTCQAFGAVLPPALTMAFAAESTTLKGCYDQLYCDAQRPFFTPLTKCFHAMVRTLGGL